MIVYKGCPEFFLQPMIEVRTKAYQILSSSAVSVTSTKVAHAKGRNVSRSPAWP